MNLEQQSLVVCGTDTDIGKTIISALLVQGLNAMYWKPIQSGYEEGTDTNRICELLNLKEQRWIPEVYKFQAPVSPHWAAEKEGKMVEPSRLSLPITQSPLIIETAGGLMVPLNRQWLQIDQLKVWDLPILLVSKSGLGTLNHTLLSIEALRKRNIPILGIILNGPKHLDNPQTLKEFGQVPIIGEIPYFKKVTSTNLEKVWREQKLHSKIQELIAKY